jgi:hypothetical protein
VQRQDLHVGRRLLHGQHLQHDQRHLLPLSSALRPSLHGVLAAALAVAACARKSEPGVW